MDKVDGIDHLCATRSWKCLTQREHLLILFMRFGWLNGRQRTWASYHGIIEPLILIDKPSTELRPRSERVQQLTDDTHDLEMDGRTSKAGEPQEPIVLYHFTSVDTELGGVDITIVHELPQNCSGKRSHRERTARLAATESNAWCYQVARSIACSMMYILQRSGSSLGCKTWHQKCLWLAYVLLTFCGAPRQCSARLTRLGAGCTVLIKMAVPSPLLTHTTRTQDNMEKVQYSAFDGYWWCPYHRQPLTLSCELWPWWALAVG